MRPTHIASEPEPVWREYTAEKALLKVEKEDQGKAMLLMAVLVGDQKEAGWLWWSTVNTR